MYTVKPERNYSLIIHRVMIFIGAVSAATIIINVLNIAT